MTSVLIKRGRDTKRYTQGRRSCDNRGKDWSDAPTSQEMPKIAGSHQKLGRGKKGFFPRPFRGSKSCQH